MRITSYFIYLLFIFSDLPSHAGWVNRKAEGWAWYEEMESEPEEKCIEAPVKCVSASEQLEGSKKILAEKLAKALLDPSEENVHEYMKEESTRMQQASEFSKAWAKSLLSHPDLDYTAKQNSVSFYGSQVQKRVQQEKKEHLIQEVAEEYGLFFFYNGLEQESHAFASVVKLIEEKYHFHVLGISADGYLIDKIKNNQTDSGIVKSLNVEIFPSLFLVNPKTKNIIPISFGMRALDQVEENIFMQFNEGKND